MLRIHRLRRTCVCQRDSLAAAAFSCCAIERTRTDDERDEREEEEDEIVVAADDDDDAKPRRRRGPGERATAEAPPRRGAAGAADDEAHAQAGPREDARERDDAVIVIVRTRKKLDKERGKKERRKSVWSSVSRFRRARLSLKPRKNSHHASTKSHFLFSPVPARSLFSSGCVHAPLSPANHAGREDDAPDQLAAVLPLEGRLRPGVDICPLVVVGRCAKTRASPSSPRCFRQRCFFFVVLFARALRRVALARPVLGPADEPRRSPLGPRRRGGLEVRPRLGEKQGARGCKGRRGEARQGEIELSRKEKRRAFFATRDPASLGLSFRCWRSAISHASTWRVRRWRERAKRARRERSLSIGPNKTKTKNLLRSALNLFLQNISSPSSTHK